MKPGPQMQDLAAYVDWFRGAAPYINAHRGRTLVVQFGGESVLSPRFTNLIHDIALLDTLGIRLVLVHGTRPQIEQRLERLGIETRVVGGLRITDDETLAVAKEAAGAVRLEIEARLSMGLANSPMAGARIRVVSGNFVTARPIGVRKGVDYLHTGEVRRIDVAGIARPLGEGAIVLLSPIGFSPTGAQFSLGAEALATSVAIGLEATKLLLLGDTTDLCDADGRPLRQLTLAEAEARLRAIRDSATARPVAARHLSSAIRACRGGVKRAHLLDARIDGALALELFTRDGVGTMVCADPYDETRQATIDDVGGILALIAPLEERGVLVPRPRHKLEAEIDRFIVMERDGAVIACAAAYPGQDGASVELACLAVHPDYRGEERALALLRAVENEAEARGARTLFVLTTQTTEWFLENGFTAARIEELPVDRRLLYNYQRNSKVLMKTLRRPERPA